MSVTNKVKGLILQPMYQNTLFEGTMELMDDGKLRGELYDRWGESEISGKLQKDKMNFAKKYSHRPDMIFYSLKKQGSLWLGAYQGDTTGIGGAQLELYLEQPLVDWEQRAETETLDEEIAEAFSKDLVRSMGDKGLIEMFKDKETGEEMIRLVNERPRPKPDSN